MKSVNQILNHPIDRKVKMLSGAVPDWLSHRELMQLFLSNENRAS